VGLGVDGEVGAEADEVRDRLEIAADEAELLLRIGTLPVPPSPLRCGRLAYKPWRIMRVWAVPSIKFFFLKELSLNSSSH
jgi:hypothetical protein